jgi:hypothetical protein
LCIGSFDIGLAAAIVSVAVAVTLISYKSKMQEDMIGVRDRMRLWPKKTAKRRRKSRG